MPKTADRLIGYSRLENESDEESFQVHHGFQGQQNRCRLSPYHAGIVCLVFVVMTGALFYSAHFASGLITSDPTSTCKNASFRREWRSLSENEKHHYLDSVKCLHQKPSRLGLNQSLYHDFAWVHYRVGGRSHEAAPFLAWHRYFLHTFHQIMQEECAYSGQMTYWDWSLDWKNITISPVWRADLGFGGNGDPHEGEEILHGHCVVDGPFAHTTIPLLDDESHPHCLSRGFETGEALLEHGRWFNPSALEKLLEINDYNDFNLGLEHGPHNAIPRSIRGDFLLLTAPFDPVFFLHHTQLDRLWWIWQHYDSSRLQLYNGKAYHNATNQASLEDLLSVGELGPQTKVASIIDTESSLLCYRY